MKHEKRLFKETCRCVCGCRYGIFHGCLRKGLDVQIVQPPEDGAALMCSAGQAQFAIEAQDTMAASLDSDAPLDITAVAAVLQHNTSGIMSRKGDGIDTPAGMTGKTYSTWESPIELATLETVVSEDGGDFSKVKLIHHRRTGCTDCSSDRCHLGILRLGRHQRKTGKYRL